MKVDVKITPTMNITFEGASQADVWQQLANLQEVFGETKCGKCNGPNLRFVVRDVEENKYFELRCKKCGARLSFGQHKTGGSLFPKRKDDDGYLPDGGWMKWNAEKQCNE